MGVKKSSWMMVLMPLQPRSPRVILLVVLVHPGHDSWVGAALYNKRLLRAGDNCCTVMQ
jgi:hypothetical protein